jgi:hypothetical protein
MIGINNKKGQMVGPNMISLLFGIFIAVIVFSVANGVLPELTASQNEGRNMNGLNCASGAGSFDINGVPMYNASMPHDNRLTCLTSGYFLPMFFLSIIIGMVSALMSGKILGGISSGSAQPVENYPQYN